MVIYDFCYAQATPDEAAYRAFLEAVDAVSYLHEIEPGRLLVVPTIRRHSLRDAVEGSIARDATLTVRAVMENTYKDPAAHRFVDQWLISRLTACVKNPEGFSPEDRQHRPDGRC